MSTSVPKEGIRSLVSQYTGIPASNVIWDGEPLPITGGKQIRLSVLGRRSIGWDEETRAYPDPNTTVITVAGIRVLTITVKAENFDTSEIAADTLEAFITEIGFNLDRITFAALGIALVSWSDVRAFTETRGNRRITTASVDLEFNQTVTKTKTISQPGYIENVHMHGEDDLSPAGEIDVDT